MLFVLAVVSINEERGNSYVTPVKTEVGLQSVVDA
jgi:hypothetical protein